MKCSVCLFLSALLWFAPVSGQAGGLKLGFFGSPAGGYTASFSDVAKAVGAIKVKFGAGVHVPSALKMEPGRHAKYAALLDGVFTGVTAVTSATAKSLEQMRQEPGIVAWIDHGSWVSVPPAVRVKLGRQDDPSIALDEVFAAAPLRTLGIWKSVAKFWKAYDVPASFYWLRPICCTPLPPCCRPPPSPSCPCPCPEPLPFGDLRGKYVPPGGHVAMMKALGAKVLPYGVKLTLNAENFGPVVDDAMRKLATQYPGFRNEYIASGSGKLEPRLKAERLK